jgi:4-hydroxy-2-oxoglutarate aldolase
MRSTPSVMPALITPFDQAGELDAKAHAHNVGFLTGMGCEGFILGGSNGEGPYLEPGERGRLLETARHVAPKAHLMAGIMAESIRQGMSQVGECQEADSVLVMTPTTLVRHNPVAVASYFSALADQSEAPVFLYSVPPTTAYSLDLDLVAELAEHPNIVGMKDSSGDVVRLQAIVDATPNDFLVYSGASPAATAAVAVGCNGVITGSANYAFGLVTAVVEAARSDLAQARRLQTHLTVLSQTVERLGIPGVKAASRAAGLDPGLPRLPLEQLAAPLAEEIGLLVGERTGVV